VNNKSNPKGVNTFGPIPKTEAIFVMAYYLSRRIKAYLMLKLELSFYIDLLN